MNNEIILDPEIEELLNSCKTIDELLKETEDFEPLNLDKDPEYVADFMKGMLIEDILKAMEELNINKTQLAEKLGKSKQYVGRILNETANFTFATVAHIACALDMQAQTRIYRKDEVLDIVKKSFKVETINASWELFTTPNQTFVNEAYINALADDSGNNVAFKNYDSKNITPQRIA